MTEDFEIEPMTCGYCGVEIEGCIWEGALNHACHDIDPEYRTALERRIDSERKKVKE